MLSPRGQKAHTRAFLAERRHFKQPPPRSKLMFRITITFPGAVLIWLPAVTSQKAPLLMSSVCVALEPVHTFQAHHL